MGETKLQEGLMELVRTAERIIARTTFDERAAPKAAGFRWDPTAKQWWTTSLDVAARLRDHAEAELRAELEAWAAKAQQAIEASRATDFQGDIPAPAGLAYLPYQRAGIAYGMARESVLIGDEMGLGKTIQAIGIANADPSCRSILIICPASLKLNWAREWRKWDVKGLTIGTDVVIVNYDMLKKGEAALRSRPWDLLIADECHYAKNPKAQRTVYLLGGKLKEGKGKAAIEIEVEPIKARRRVCLTGTPILNRPIELWPLVHSLDPQGLGASWKRYVTRYCAGHQTAYGWDVTGSSNPAELQERLRAAIMVRRLKRDVLTELPAKRRAAVLIEPDGDMAATIAREQAEYEKGLAAIEAARVAVELAKAEGEDVYSAAVKRLTDAAQVAFEEVSKMRHALALAKLPACVEFLRSATEAGKVVAFCHHIDVMRAVMAEFGDACVGLSGETSLADRQAAVDRFQSDPSCSLFIGTIKAAGVGLTLTASSHVVFLELDWVPGNVTQAEDRCHRIGQRDMVLVQHLVVDGSLDARMAQTLIDKQAVIDAALDDTTRGELLAQIEVPPASAPVQAAQASTERVTTEPATKSVTRRQIEQEAVVMAPEQVAAVHSCLRILAGLDADRASDLNGIGFNRMDTMIGHSLAERGALTAKQAALGLRIVRKYHRQLPGELLAAAKGAA